ncbi:MAG: efflux transporter periplasmic adaptor subunit [Bacteroidetes bacterium CG18_big_fil_WC_8_21_14_2_50_41_14]|nr:MAG: efflux transporter periplasmic adaptor subunit [Bacteroidetes bacterium CG18_big_fil_WC_8_21_14_2_50_41_14]PJB58966.1 MAG: efflux transporter periplasmic adaptor subunit [Bacteroidetes bacterium CG_4_9_14_3_um_filter_41_19]
MKTFFKILAAVIVLGIFGYTIYFLYQKSQTKPIVYETSNPVISNVIKKTTATGSVIPRKEIEIKPVVSGIVDELYVVEGQQLKKGDLIAKIRIIPNMINLNNAKSGVETAKIKLEDAKRNYDRQLELLEKGVIAKADYESYEINYKNALEELETAEETLQLIRDGQIQKQSSQTNTLVKSTIDGMVLDVPVEIGNQVIESNNFNAGTTIASVADMGEMMFEGNIDESEVGKIKEGMPLLLTIGALENVTFDAVLEQISPKGTEVNGAVQFKIKADVKLRNDQFIRSGYSANADIVLARADSVMTISEGLLQFDDSSTFVEVEVQPQIFEKRAVETGLSDGINIEVVSGINMEDKVKKLK